MAEPTPVDPAEMSRRCLAARDGRALHEQLALTRAAVRWHERAKAAQSFPGFKASTPRVAGGG